MQKLVIWAFLTLITSVAIAAAIWFFGSAVASAGDAAMVINPLEWSRDGRRLGAALWATFTMMGGFFWLLAMLDED